MFLNELNRELGIAYINLLIEFALVDDKVEQKERELIERSLKEMNLEKLELNKINREEIIEIIKNAGERVVNIVFFELTRVALADAEYEMDEVDFIDELAKEFNISRAKRFQMANYFFKHSEYDEINEDLAKKEAEAFLN
ncbi:hypothetical protein [Clostridium septicum]|uniref:Co-chaperone DjlA N-terminal domain-containing protein n=1 Tax=Clostridium septicum TaxID=1504 RepID=A0A9N7JMX4_CLOSE|nr:hypothetical protein [Clostridium septicum]AYE34612.1 hypothetical protein CP523_09330 [Clostridium septicum]QAS60012.1 hypothetical protein EI377_04075 [Clostridium septicum]UEC20748.1 hypothetical protein LK444_15505 [Clostridium septicum]USS01202.1 hypothetical protein NH397_01665 [Clostridium septicum]